MLSARGFLGVVLSLFPAWLTRVSSIESVLNSFVSEMTENYIDAFEDC